MLDETPTYTAKHAARGEELARMFHEIYERRAPEFGYQTRAETRHFDTITANGRLMIAVCTDIADKLLGAIPHDRYENDEIAKRIYEGWSDELGYVPWVERGNSLKQDEARQLAHTVVDMGSEWPAVEAHMRANGIGSKT